MPRVPIADIDDPRVAIYRHLKATNLTRSRDRFVVEGEKLLGRLLESRFPVESVLVSDRHERRVAAGVPEDVPLFVAPHAMIDVLVGFNFHQGVLASGVDTFSKHTLDQTMKQLRQSDVTIFAIGLDKTFTNYLESHGAMGSNLNYLQAENQLKTFAQETGGYSWFPQFDGEIPGVFKDLTAYLRNQYSLSYTPSAGANDGKFHKVKVELVSPDGSPLSVTDQKGKKQKLVVYAREGYTAVKGGVGD